MLPARTQTWASSLIALLSTIPSPFIFRGNGVTLFLLLTVLVLDVLLQISLLLLGDSPFHSENWVCWSGYEGWVRANNGSQRMRPSEWATLHLSAFSLNAKCVLSTPSFITLSVFFRMWGFLTGLPPPWGPFDIASCQSSLSARRAWLDFSSYFPLVWVPCGGCDLHSHTRNLLSSLPTSSCQSKDGHFTHPLLSMVHFLRVRESAAFYEPPSPEQF